MIFSTMRNQKQLDHPNVQNLYDLYEDDHKYYMVTELCRGGDLFDHIQNKGVLSEEDARTVIRMLLSVIRFYNRYNIVHRDLKPENLKLLTRDFESLQVCEFGFSCHYAKGQMLVEKIGTPYYIAPEVIDQKYERKAKLESEKEKILDHLHMLD